MKALIFGIQGQLGLALSKELPNAPTCSVEQIDFSLPAAELLPLITKVLDEHAPNVVFNAAAYTAVDQAETNKELCWAINARAPEILSRACAERKILVVHYSTDYVYNPPNNRPRRETATPDPINEYGRSKLAGDLAIQATNPAHLIFRTSWVFDSNGKNFVNTMLRLAGEKEEIQVVGDQVGSPTFARDLARGSIAAAEKFLTAKAPEKLSGIYHLTNQGYTSWYDFAEEIFSGARRRGIHLRVTQVTPIATAEYPTPAQRPLNSRLYLDKFTETFGWQPPHWQTALEDCLNEKFGNHISP